MSQKDINLESVAPKYPVKPVVFSIIILISGIIIGACLSLLLIPKFSQERMPTGPEQMSERMVMRIVRELELSEEQKKQLRPIITTHMKAIDDIRKEAQPKISELLSQMNEQILNILDQQQKDRWQESVRRMQERFSRMRERRGPRDGRNDPGRRGPGPDFKRRSPNQQHPPDPMPPVPMPPLQDQPVEPIEPPME